MQSYYKEAGLMTADEARRWVGVGTQTFNCFIFRLRENKYDVLQRHAAYVSPPQCSVLARGEHASCVVAVCLSSVLLSSSSFTASASFPPLPSPKCGKSRKRGGRGRVLAKWLTSARIGLGREGRSGSRGVGRGGIAGTHIGAHTLDAAGVSNISRG